MPANDLKQFHAMASSNVLKTKTTRTSERIVGYLPDTSSLQQKDLLTGHTKAVPYKYLPLNRETRGDLRPAW